MNPFQDLEGEIATLDAAPANKAKEMISALLSSDKPKVELPGDDRLLSAFAVELGKIMKPHGLYQRGGLAFIANRRGDGLEVVTPQMLRTIVENYLVCYRIKGAGEKAILFERTMSESDAKGVLSSQQFLDKLPEIQKVSTARLPVLRSNGTIELLPPGHDAESLILTLPQCEYDENMSLSEARQILDTLLFEFPFVTDNGRSKAVVISAMVGLFAAGLIQKESPRPIFICLANAEGAGKTILAKCAISPVHGLVKTDGDLKDKEETRKELLTAVIEARPYILFDNCKGHLNSTSLEGFVTASIYSGRVLGVNKSFSGENNVTVFITGNACTVSPDLRRRSLFIELFMEEERAEEREFRTVLDDAALLTVRSDILAALFALVREWDIAGRPQPSRSHGSFPRWAETIGGIVEHAGYGCPLETADIKNAADTDSTDMRQLVRLLASGEEVRFDDIVSKAREYGLFERFVGSDTDPLTPSMKSAFGKLLRRYHLRRFDGNNVFDVEGSGHSRRFRVVTKCNSVHGEHGDHGGLAESEPIRDFKMMKTPC
jgi:hypothetical protein